MPKVFVYGPYVFFFWMGEDNEPVHVHVAIKRPVENATKFWLTAGGGCVLANNNSQIPEKDLRDIAKIIKYNHRFICARWVEIFGSHSLSFYC